MSDLGKKLTVASMLALQLAMGPSSASDASAGSADAFNKSSVPDSLRNHLNDGTNEYYERYRSPKKEGELVTKDDPCRKYPYTEYSGVGLALESYNVSMRRTLYEDGSHIMFFPETKTAPDVYMYRGDYNAQSMNGSEAPLEIYLPSGAYNPDSDRTDISPVDRIAGEGGYDVVILPGHLEEYKFSVPAEGAFFSDVPVWEKTKSVYGLVIQAKRSVDDGFGGKVEETVSLQDVDRVIFSGEAASIAAESGLQYEDMSAFFDAVKRGVFETLTNEELIKHMESKSTPDEVALMKASSTYDAAILVRKIGTILGNEYKGMDENDRPSSSSKEKTLSAFEMVRGSLDLRLQMMEQEQGSGDGFTREEYEIARRAVDLAIHNIDNDFQPHQFRSDAVNSTHAMRAAAEKIRDGFGRNIDSIPNSIGVENDASADPVVNRRLFPF